VKRVLAIAFDFPPRRTSAVYRIVGLLRYLRGFGWDPTVLTVQPLKGDIEDGTLQGKLPRDLQVVRTPYVNISGWEETALEGVRTLRQPEERPAVSGRGSSTPPFLRSAAEFLRSCFYFPDDTVGWIPFALSEAIRLHFEKPFDAIYTTSPPRSAPVVGLLFKSLLNIPWVAEFRDPWYPPKRPWRRMFERRLLLAMLKKATKVVVHSRGYGEELRKSYGVPASKVAVICNGFDEDDFAPSACASTNLFTPGHLHLSHFGTVYPNFSGEFFPALAELVEERPELKERLRVNIIGFPDDVVFRYAASSGLGEVIRVHKFIQHDEAVAAMRASHGLLLFLAKPEVSRLSGLGKIYEYLRVGRPILAVAPEGGTRELVLQAEAGWAVHPEDRLGIKSALLQIAQQNPSDPPALPKKPDFVNQFRYDKLSHQLALVFDEAANRQ
jgi:glycosyltransferase involved in cell wall biosynthesis